VIHFAGYPYSAVPKELCGKFPFSAFFYTSSPSGVLHNLTPRMPRWTTPLILLGLGCLSLRTLRRPPLWGRLSRPLCHLFPPVHPGRPSPPPSNINSFW